MNLEAVNEAQTHRFGISEKLAAQNLTDLEAGTAYLEAVKPTHFDWEERIDGRYYFGHHVITAFQSGAAYKSGQTSFDGVRYQAGFTFLHTLEHDGAEDETDAPYYHPPVIIAAFQAGIEWQKDRNRKDVDA